MTFKQGDEVMVSFSDEWCRGVVMSAERGYVMAHIERPANLGSISDRAPDKPIVMVHADRVKPRKEDA
jgi:hypothetical protein